MSRVYLDASAIIYFVEAESPFHAVAVQSVGRFRGDPESRLVTSRLSLLECRVKPRRDGKDDLLAKYDAFFKRRRHLRYERSGLRFSADYLRGRCMKTDVAVRPDGSATIETRNRGESALRWVQLLKGRKHLTVVAATS